MLNITLLGSGGGMPIPDRFLSALHIDYKGRKILIDCGEGYKKNAPNSSFSLAHPNYLFP